ncbi:MAG: hypothetical protein K9K86_11645 [Pseudomonadales bacterium]|nr:hypothetical protein [Pseudomonadales bacterium]
MPRLYQIFVVLITLSIPSITSAIKLTIYDDGRSCPSNCDSHVVFHPAMNGTVYAHMPGSISPKFEKCSKNSNCEICFEENDSDQCLVVMYRGGGPHKNTYDFTPAFYEQWCDKSDIPDILSSKCRELERMASKLDGRVNCIMNREHVSCINIMKAVVTEKEIDEPVYRQCLKVGEKNFNKGRSDSDKRINNCAYGYESNGGPNSNGKTWHKLLAGACRENTFVGRNGLDCCSGIKFIDAALGIECKKFYPKEK